MFTGLVREIGTIERLHPASGKTEIEIRAPGLAPELELGDSVSVNGACQTVVRVTASNVTVEALAETLQKTTLGALRPGHRVNLEPAVTPATPLGGHFVQGHVNGTGTVARLDQDQENVYLTVELPKDLLPYCVAEGSVAIDGVSLTIARLGAREITINIIPHTWSETVLADRGVGDSVNIETDIIARYVERFLDARETHRSGLGSRPGSGAGPSPEQLATWGYA